MRELKFRAWVKKDKAMVSDVKVSDSLNEKFKCDSVILMQYTGRSDANDVDIYEGDIASVDGDACEVKFSGGAFHVDVCGYDYDYTAIGWAMDNGHYIEVIGNIHQNPELLK